MSKRGRPAKSVQKPAQKMVAQSAPKKKTKGAIDYSLNQDIANQLRIDSINSVHVSKSGHPSSCASIAQVFSVLFFHQSGLKFHPDNHKHFLNDRIVLSKGHAAPILYSALYRAKTLSQQQLMSLRLKDSLIQGHPVPKIPFVDVATGSLGQGLSVACGMAYSSKYFDKIDNRIFCICGDGQTAEGSIWEACDFARIHKLNNLTAFIDVNRLGQSQQTMFQHKTDIFKSKLSAFGWNALEIDGHNVAQIVSALQKARKQTQKPTVIICKTFKGKNLGQNIENKLDWHGKDLGDKTNQVIQHIKSLMKNQNLQYKTNTPQGDDLKTQLGNVTVTPNYQPGAKISTRKAYGQALKKARQSNPNVVGLDGDTKNSTFAITLKEAFPESFIECFIAEQNLVGVATGLSCRRKIPFCSTFAAFFSRAADQIRIAGIGGNPIKMVGSHTGCSIGQDGPSQMALQDLGFFRNIPNGLVLLPSDGVSTQKSVQLVGNYHDGPAFIRTNRPDVPVLYKNDQHFELGKCKILKSSGQDKVALIGHGVTTHECLKAYQILAGQGIKVRVIDVFSLKPFDNEGIKKNIEQCGGNFLVAQDHYEAGSAFEAVCAAATSSIKKFKHLCVHKVPGSAKPSQQLEIHGIDSKNIAQHAKQLIQ